MKTNLTQQEKDFLAGYYPQDQHWTSEQEIKSIAENLNLASVNDEDARNMRKMVQEYYHELQDNEIMFDVDGTYMCRTEKYFQLFTSMLSVMAVIDSRIYLQ